MGALLFPKNLTGLKIMYSIKTAGHTLVFANEGEYLMALEEASLRGAIMLADVVHHDKKGFTKARHTDLKLLNVALMDTEVKPELSPKEALLAKISSKLATPTMYTDAITFEKAVSSLLDDYEITLKEPKGE